MKVMNMVNSINQALEIKLTENEDIVIYGEDSGYEGGIFRVTEGLQEKFGEKRVFDSPLAESAIAGTALGMANILSQGDDLTIVSYGAMIREVQKAVVMAKHNNISVELIDLRSIFPLDRETIANSVKKTGRMLFVNEGPASFGVGAEIISIVNEEAFLSLEAPPTRLSGFDTVIPLPMGEHFYQNDSSRIYYEIEKLVNF